MKKYLIPALLYFSAALSAFAQSPSRADVINEAQNLFASGRYAEARSALLSIVAENEKDPRVCYLLGASSALCGQDPDGAVRMLRFAQMRNYQKNQANLYVGRAYQLSCEYEQAQQAFDKFLKSNPADSLSRQAERWLAECDNSVALASKIFSVRTLRRTPLRQQELLAAYHASSDAGTVCRNSEFFQSDIDPDGLMYRTERGDAVYFAVPDDDGHRRLQKVEQLIGGWSDMTPLRGTQPADGDEGEDIMPFLMTDGVTLYFSSNRAGGMGGYDIYRTSYDSESRSFTEPQNMGVPFNSAADDFLFVADESKQRAWFASNRAVGQDSLMVYEIVWDNSVIRNFAKSTSEIRQALAMVSEETETTTSTATHSVENVKLRDQFRLPICDTLTYTQWEHFRSRLAERKYRQALTVGQEKDSLTHLMATQRKEFAALSSSSDRNAKLQELLATERRIYALEDEMADRVESARNEEIIALQKLISEGRYTPLCKIFIRQKTRAIDWNTLLKPSNFEAYTATAFADMTDEDILDALSDADAREVSRQDSMLGWTTILKLEADIILEHVRSGNMPTTTGPDGQPVPMSAKEASRRAADYRQAAILLAARAHDTKRAIFRVALNKMRSSVKSQYDASEVSDLQAKADNYFSLVEDVDLAQAKAPTASNVLNMKARGVKTYCKALLRIVAHNDGTFLLPLVSSADGDKAVEPDPAPENVIAPVADEPAPTSTETPPAPAQTVVPEPVSPEPAAPAPAKSEPANPVVAQPAAVPAAFRVQLGAFRKKPAALAQLPDPSLVTSMPINDNRGLTRYYYGSYSSKADADAAMTAARAAGFTPTLIKL